MRPWLVMLFAVGCGNQTVCASEDALAMDDRMPEIVRLAVAYWDDRGWHGIVAVDGSRCDIPVTLDSAIPQWARIDVTEPIHDRTACWGDALRVNPDKWPLSVADGLEVRVMAHEIGHLHCLEDIDIGDGVMSRRKYVGGLEGYQLEVNATLKGGG